MGESCGRFAVYLNLCFIPVLLFSTGSLCCEIDSDCCGRQFHLLHDLLHALQSVAAVPPLLGLLQDLRALQQRGMLAGAQHLCGIDGN